MGVFVGVGVVVVVVVEMLLGGWCAGQWVGVVRTWLGVGGAVWGSGGLGLGLVAGDQVDEVGGEQLGPLRAWRGGRGDG